MKAILTYHSIDPSGSPISVDTGTFDRQFRWLTHGSVRAIPLDDLVTGRAPSGDVVSVTFDDGFLNIIPAADRLLDAGVVPTIFVVTKHVGGTNAWGGKNQAGIPTMPLLGWTDLERLAKRGARIEAHTRTHPHLTRVSAEQLADELDGSRDDLERQLGQRPGHFAYPYGDVNHAVAERARSAFACAYTTEMSALGGRDDAARLPRLDMYYFQSPGALDPFGAPAFARRLAWIRARRAVRALVFR
ncbi:MAG TPA: polysaccharide deacetylase family protein [Vicinamibacterales bacterium]|nr:polysaccharide deacetylase family protein [Vicinamibacterales bacterium]